MEHGLVPREIREMLLGLMFMEILFMKILKMIFLQTDMELLLLMVTGGTMKIQKTIEII